MSSYKQVAEDAIGDLEHLHEELSGHLKEIKDFVEGDLQERKSRLAEAEHLAEQAGTAIRRQAQGSTTLRFTDQDGDSWLVEAQSMDIASTRDEFGKYTHEVTLSGNVEATMVEPGSLGIEGWSSSGVGEVFQAFQRPFAQRVNLQVNHIAGMMDGQPKWEVGYYDEEAPEGSDFIHSVIIRASDLASAHQTAEDLGLERIEYVRKAN